MNDINEWNRQVIEEFRANAGEVKGVFTGIPLVILHNVGAKSGETRLNPLAYQQLDEGVAIFGSMGGSPKNPAWFHNILANPKVTLEFGDRTVEAVARVVTGDERSRIWEKQKVDQPQFAEYEKKTDRQIPVVVLEPLAA